MVRSIVNRLAAFITIICMVISFAIVSVPEKVSAAGTTYYVDSVSGNDGNSGTGTGTAWKSLTKVNGTTFAPGDRILFKAGGSWSGQLFPKGSGASGSPIVIDMYGTGNKPKINGGGIGAAVYLSNQEYWEINNLEITNDDDFSVDCNTSSVWSRMGIKIFANNGTTMDHIYIKNCYIHDVDCYNDGDKMSGGIGMVGENTGTYYNDIKVENNTITKVDRTGIRLPDIAGYKVCTNVVIRNNTLSDIGGDGITLKDSVSGLVEYNVVNRSHNRSTASNVAIWAYGCKDALIQYNEAYNTQTTKDGQGFDCDYHCEGTTMQYNYSHNNVGGFMLICFNGGTDDGSNGNYDAVVRYNISQNDGFILLRIQDEGVKNAQVYNNTIYVPSGSNVSKVVSTANSATGSVRNNIFYILNGATFTDNGSTGVTFDSNCYYGFNGPSSDANRLNADPKLQNPGGASVGRDTCTAYKLQSTSPCINEGVSISGNGGKDFFGNTLYNGAPDIGAHEHQGSTTTPTPTPSPSTFSDDFEDGNSSGWTNVNGSWSVVSDGSKVFKQTSTTGEALTYAGSSSWTDYSVQAGIKLYDTPTSWASGIVGRYKDGNNYYLFRLTSGKLQLYKKSGGTFTLLKETSYTSSTNTWYTLKLSFTGSTIKGYVNGVEKISTTDSSITSGSIGLRTYKQTAAFDNVVVE